MSFACPMAQMVKNPPTMQETRVQSLGGEDALEKGTAPTPVFLPGESHGQRSLVGYGPWGHKELDTTEQLILLTCLLMSMIRSARSLHCYKADSFNQFSCFIHSTNTHWVLGSEQVLGVLRWAADSLAPLPGTPGWGGSQRWRWRVLVLRTLERGVCVVSQEPHIYFPFGCHKSTWDLTKLGSLSELGSLSVASLRNWPTDCRARHHQHWVWWQLHHYWPPDWNTVCQSFTLWAKHTGLPRGVAPPLRGPPWRTTLAWDICVECLPRNLPEAHLCW